ncbi:MAG: hypothetical protein EOO11_23610 [Chitinophagaceae bacterium]|nr:MAG: hypothetical protein EOO11_23610 [Chitinophagaceae bacterium]
MTVLIATACRKEDKPAGPATETPAPPPADDRRTVRLRSIEETGMPAPYYSFTYDPDGYVTDISFAGGFFRYTVTYAQKRVTQVRNTPDGALLQYHYSNGRVDAIHKTDSNGEPVWDYLFTYNTNGRLETVRWVQLQAGSAATVRRVELTYDAAGELSEWKDFHDINGTLTWLRTFRYSNYDSAVNVDDFGLLKSFFEDVLFLPSVRLQQHNPRHVTLLGPVNDFGIDYTFTYANGLPATRDGIMRQTRGGTGAPITLRSQYAYF